MNRPRSPCPDGVLLVRKPPGCTSFDVVRRIKPRVRPCKVGHTGTLDPMATGLLPLCIGEATKISRFLTGGTKRYRARVRLGVATDTLDREGARTAPAPIPTLTDGQIQACLARFVGTIQQIPPIYSALRHRGKRLYQLAREGVEVERKPRTVQIESLHLLARQPDRLELDIVCGPGTYVRTLAADIAEALGTLGHLEELERTETSGWTLDQARDLEELATCEPARLYAAILPLEKVLSRLPRVDVSTELVHRLSCGQHLSPSELQALPLPRTTGPIWLCPPEGFPLVVARLRELSPPDLEILRVLHPAGRSQVPG